jgi:hypothetical protein
VELLEKWDDVSLYGPKRSVMDTVKNHRVPYKAGVTSATENPQLHMEDSAP